MVICLTALAPPSATAQGAKKKGTKAVAAAKGAIEIRMDRQKKFRFFYMGAEGNTLAMCTRGYDTEADVKKAIGEVKALVGKSDGIQFAKDRGGKFRFSVKDGTGKTLAMCTRGYETEADAKKVAEEVKALAISATPTVK
jgi:uncharacterized protein YegP (UPF0339 family)